MRMQLQKHIQILKEKEAEAAQIEHRPSVQRRRREQVTIPFGIRALESGIEVDGVWISPRNSPASSAPSSPVLAASMIDGPEPRQSVSDLAGLDAVSGDIASSGHALLSTWLPRTRASSAAAKHHRASYNPGYKPRNSSQLRYSSIGSARSSSPASVQSGHEGAERRSAARTYQIPNAAPPLRTSTG